MWKQKQEVLTTAIESSREKLKAMQTAQKSISDQLRDGNIDKGAYDKFKQDVEKAQNKLAKLKAEQTEIEKKFDNKEIDQEAYDKFRRKVENAEKKVKDLRIAEKGLKKVSVSAMSVKMPTENSAASWSEPKQMCAISAISWARLKATSKAREMKHRTPQTMSRSLAITPKK